MKARSSIAFALCLGLFACSASDGSDGNGPGGGAFPDRPPALGKADAWNYKNDPKKLADFLDKELDYAMDALPLQGTAKTITPWPDTYWPTYQDGTNARWKSPTELSPLEKYDVAFNGWTADDAFMQLKPFNAKNCTAAWDKEYYEKLGPAAKYQSANKGNAKARDGVDSDGDGQVDECDDNDGVESWWGLCHAWVPAALNEKEPVHPVTLNGVTFYPADIKALLQTIYDRSRSIIVGGRCNAKEVERDETGRIKDENCRDTNAGAFHLILTNLLGIHGMPFAEDRTYDYEVWNQPVYDYNITLNQEIDVTKANELLGVTGDTYQYNPDAKRFWQVQVTVRYVTESHAEDHALIPTLQSYLRTDKYHYVVEGDADGKVIGGEWVPKGGSSNHGFWGASDQPDFLWASVGPAGETTSNPHVKYSKVKELLELSLRDPNQPPPAVPSVCEAKCSSSSAQTVDGKTCYCDDACFSYGDCCEGRSEACGGPASAGSCQGHCGNTDAAPGSAPPSLCYCDTACATRGDCCADYGTHCGS